MIGRRIAEHLEFYMKGAEVEALHINTLLSSYCLACLLHDVAHAPFSHTFEVYYGNKLKLKQMLVNELLHKGLNSTLIETELDDKNSAEHELASAIVTVAAYYSFLINEPNHPDVELICRMIVGCRYKDRSKSLENCFIDLLHGEVDADRLDYAFRDVWASGYSTATIDLDRLIDGMSLELSKTGEWIIVFDNKVINELETLHDIKAFQNKSVFSHHTIQYEQHLLVCAMSEIAKMIYGEESLYKLCDINNLIEGRWNTNDSPLSYMSDDDFIYLIKQNLDEHPTIREWFSRKYTKYSLWRSYAEYKCLFKNIIKDKSVSVERKEESLIKKIKEETNCHDGDIFAQRVQIKSSVKLGDLNIKLGNGKILKYHEIYDWHPKDTIEFTYIYVEKTLKTQLDNILPTIINSVNAEIANERFVKTVLLKVF